VQFAVQSSQTSQAFVSVLCSFETATSQIRICIVLCALYATYLAYTAAKQESRKIVDTYLSAVAFLSFLLVTTSCFDVLAIFDSQNDNFTMCSLSHGSHLTQWTKQGTPCSFLHFWLISIFCFASAIIVYMSHNIMT
jgi:hypothetical protein